MCSSYCLWNAQQSLAKRNRAAGRSKFRPARAVHIRRAATEWSVTKVTESEVALPYHICRYWVAEKKHRLRRKGKRLHRLMLVSISSQINL